MFLLYNEGRLNSFGWAFLGMEPGPRYEHPTGAAAGVSKVVYSSL